MYKSPFSMSMIVIMFTSTLMAISSSNWLMLWMALEINMLSFIPIMLTSMKFQETEATIKYFMAQAIGSSLLIFSSMSLWTMNSLHSTMFTILLLAVTMKIGMFPCHFWYTSVMSSVSWMTALLLSTWQKLAPLTILSFNMTNLKHPMMMLAMMNALTGGLLGMNQSQLRTIMAYSSITHLGWMCGLISMNYPLYSMVYFIFYITLIAPMFIMFNNKNLLMTSQLSKSTAMSPKWTLSMNLLLLSLGGLPPLLGFFPKLMSMSLILNNAFTMLIVLIMGSLCNLYFYLNILFSSTLNQSTHKSTVNYKPASISFLTLLSLVMLWLPMMML